MITKFGCALIVAFTGCTVVHVFASSNWIKYIPVVPTAPGVANVLVAPASVQYVNVPASEPAVTVPAVKSTVPGEQTAAGSVITKFGCAFTVTFTGSTTAHPPPRSS